MMEWLNLGRKLQPEKADPRSGILTQHLAPGSSACGRCRTAWKFVKEHATEYDGGSAMFPLCELCWGEMTHQERLPFYYVLFRQWEWDAGRAGRDVGVRWEDIERAVLAEVESR